MKILTILLQIGFCQKQLLRVGAILRANPSLDIGDADFTAAKGILCFDLFSAD